MMERTLDGNAVGGLLLELFGVELTAAPCVCSSCPGVVVRSRHCGDVMITIVRGRERTWVDLRGTRGLELG
jgi:hypothetical protein